MHFLIKDHFNALMHCAQGIKKVVDFCRQGDPSLKLQLTRIQQMPAPPAANLLHCKFYRLIFACAAVTALLPPTRQDKMQANVNHKM